MIIPQRVFRIAALLILILQLNSTGQEPSKSIFLIGNSLTWDTVPPKLDGDVQWHVDCGKSLPWMHDHPDMPCVKSSVLWTKALRQKQYDFVTFQPHYGSSLESDVATISKWIQLQRKAVFVIHTGWARSKTRSAEYVDQASTHKMTHSPHYIRSLITALKKEYPKREFRQTHAIDLLDRVARDIKNGSAPFKKVEELYRDAIHMKLDSGRYLMHNAMRIALGQPRSAAAFKNSNPKIIKYLNQVLDSIPARAKVNAAAPGN